MINTPTDFDLLVPLRKGYSSTSKVSQLIVNKPGLSLKNIKLMVMKQSYPLSFMSCFISTNFREKYLVLAEKVAPLYSPASRQLCLPFGAEQVLYSEELFHLK